MMNTWRRISAKWLAASVAAFVLLSGAAASAQQRSRGQTPRQEIQLGRGMSLVAPGLMEVGARTTFFLQIADRINLTEEQKNKLEELVYDFRKYGLQREADLDVVDAEFRRLLTRDQVDLDAVRAKVREMEAIRTDVDMRRIEALLKAINTLTHQQHLKIMTLVQDAEKSEAQQQQRPGVY